MIWTVIMIDLYSLDGDGVGRHPDGGLLHNFFGPEAGVIYW